MSKTRPTFLLVHGAWLGGWAWTQVSSLIREQGFSVYPVDLPGHGKGNDVFESITFYSYIKEVLRVMDAEDRPMILVGHSFAGMIISQVAEFRPEKVSGLVYLSACLLPNGVSFLEAAKVIHDSIALDNLRSSQDGKTVTIEEEYLHAAIAHDVPIHTFESIRLNLVPEPVVPLGVPLSITDCGWGSAPRYYIECTKDRAIPLKAQRAMYQLLGVREVFSLESSHSPMFSCPLELSGHLLTIAQSVFENNT